MRVELRLIEVRSVFNSSVISVLKRKHQHNLRIEEIRSQHSPPKSPKWRLITILLIDLSSRIQLYKK